MGGVSRKAAAGEAGVSQSHDGKNQDDDFKSSSKKGKKPLFNDDDIDNPFGILGGAGGFEDEEDEMADEVLLNDWDEEREDSAGE